MVNDPEAGRCEQEVPILLATTNPAKQARLRWALEGLCLRPVTLAEVWPGAGVAAGWEPVAEEGASFAANAARKAIVWSARFGGLAVASDGGMHIPALGAAWEPLRTARAAGVDDDHARAEHLLRLMAPCRGEDRRVSWVEAGAVALAGELLAVWEEPGLQGVLAESFDPAAYEPGFWGASLVLVPPGDPAAGRRVTTLPPEERARLDQGWTRLRARLQSYFRSAEGERARERARRLPLREPPP